MAGTQRMWGVGDLARLAGYLLVHLSGLEPRTVAGVAVDPAVWVRKLTPPACKLEAALAGFNGRSWGKGRASVLEEVGCRDL